ncbi:MAG: DNA-directed RNA polymerase subunit alpha [Alphaproteobacteria bacterium]|jgi:DNA-directed RNA polymerase subunit alpha
MAVSQKVISKNWSDLIKPSKVDVKSKSKNKATFVVEPLERGFGTTLGNSIRRILLSSIRGAAITLVKIEGAMHEFSTVDKVREDIVNIILNLKQVAILSYVSEPQKARINVKGPAVVKAGMIEGSTNFAVVNKDFIIAHVEEGGHLNMELTITTGKGYVPASQNKPEGLAIDYIPIDAIFSPVTQVSFKVEEARVGQVTDYDKLTLTVETNGAITPEDSLSIGAAILQDQVRAFITLEQNEHKDKELKEEKLPFSPNLLKKVSDIELSVRSANCLQNDNIIYIGDLVRKSEAEMLKTPNFGRKSLNEIKFVLGEMGLRFDMKIDGWPPKNIEDLAKKYEDPYN